MFNKVRKRSGLAGPREVQQHTLHTHTHTDGQPIFMNETSVQNGPDNSANNIYVCIVYLYLYIYIRMSVCTLTYEHSRATTLFQFLIIIKIIIVFFDVPFHSSSIKTSVCKHFCVSASARARLCTCVRAYLSFIFLVCLSFLFVTNQQVRPLISQHQS